VIGLLEALPIVPVVDQAEVLHFIDVQHLYGRGFGWIDIHLLACARVAGQPLWTLDRRLALAAKELSLEPLEIRVPKFFTPRPRATDLSSGFV
jgi:hypothetical protein